MPRRGMRVGSGIEERTQGRAGGWLAAILAIAVAAVAPAASAHILVAQGANVCSYPPCADTHLEGNFETGVPGVDLNYFFLHTRADSDAGSLSIATGFSWFSGTKPFSAEYIDAAINENVDLHRIGNGPAGLRATLVLEGAGTAQGPTSLTNLSGTLNFAGCKISATKSFSPTTGTDFVPTNSCGANAKFEGSALVVTVLYDGDLPSHPQLSAGVEGDYAYLTQLTSVVEYQLAGHLYVELINTTATWDTPTFQTEAPEPEAGALGLACIASLALCARLRARSRRV